MQFSATFSKRDASPADDAAGDVRPVECERYRRADRHRETADVDVANAKEKPRNPANVYHADSRARRPPLNFSRVARGDRVAPRRRTAGGISN